MKYLGLIIISIWGLGHDISNVTTNPASPAQIDLGQTVTVNFDYETTQAGGVRITCDPKSSTSFFQHLGSGAAAYATGTGSGSSTFELTAGSGQIDGILVQMFTEDLSQLIYEGLFPVQLSYPLDPESFNPYPDCESGRWIPHVTTFGGDFSTTIVVENLSSATQSYRLRPFTSDGVSFDSVKGTISAGEVLFLDPGQVFITESVSHFQVEKSSTSLIRVLYEGPSKGSPVVIEESCQQGTLFHFVPSMWSEVFDGFAFVNVGYEPTNITLTQLDDMGQEVSNKTVVTQLVPNAKALYLPETDFTFQANSRFRIESDEPIVITALSGTRPESPVSYLWTNPIYKLK